MSGSRANFHQCVTAVETAAGREVSENELIEVFGAIQGRIRRYTAEGLTPREAAVRAGQEMGDKMRLAGEIEKRTRAINYARRAELEVRIRDGQEAADIKAILTGREGRRVGDAYSVDAMVHAIQRDILGPLLVAPLRKLGVLRALSRGDPAFDRDIARELWALEAGGGSVTKNRLAREVAEVINTAQERTRNLQNAAGAWIGKLDHYVTRQTHSMRKVREAGFDKWFASILPKLDDRTFDNLPEPTPEAVRGYMEAVYRGIASGVHMTARGADLFSPTAGSASIAKRASAERKLHFRDADAWMDYAQEFGDGNLWANVRSGIETGARNTALMRVMGTNPEAMFKTINDRAMKRAVDRGDLAASDALQKEWNSRILDVVTGKANIPGNEGWATFSNAATALATLSKLGGVVLSSIPDLATNAALLRHNGVGLFEAYGNQLRAAIPSWMKGGAQREVAELAGAGIDGVLGDVASRFQAADGAPGTASRLVDIFHKLNGLEWWTQSMERGLSTMLTHNLGRSAAKPFASLPPRLRTTLGRYGIEAADWDTIRATAARAADGRMHILPPAIENSALRTKYATYIQDQVREGMTMPDAGTRAITTWGTQAGTPAGVAARLIMQFKTYPVTFVNRTLNREWARGDGVDVAGLAHIFVATTLLGYAAMEMKNLARGRNTRTQAADDAGDYAKIIAAAMVQGGGAGLYGDFLFGAASRTGGGPVVSLLGPTVSTADEMAQTFQQFRQWAMEGDRRAGNDALAGAVGLVKNNAPFLNLFYLRGAMDYMIWYRLQEAMNPGYLSRYEQRVEREQSQTFWLSPTVSQ
jgi:hypothetical protein